MRRRPPRSGVTPRATRRLRWYSDLGLRLARVGQLFAEAEDPATPPARIQAIIAQLKAEVRELDRAIARLESQEPDRLDQDNADR